MPLFRIHHRHTAEECEAAFAAWTGHPSPLRGRTAICSCVFGGHEIWWDVDVIDEDEALGQLPQFLAERSRAGRISEHRIP